MPLPGLRFGQSGSAGYPPGRGPGAPYPDPAGISRPGCGGRPGYPGSPGPWRPPGYVGRRRLSAGPGGLIPAAPAALCGANCKRTRPAENGIKHAGARQPPQRHRAEASGPARCGIDDLVAPERQSRSGAPPAAAVAARAGLSVSLMRGLASRADGAGSPPETAIKFLEERNNPPPPAYPRQTRRTSAKVTSSCAHRGRIIGSQHYPDPKIATFWTADSMLSRFFRGNRVGRRAVL